MNAHVAKAVSTHGAKGKPNTGTRAAAQPADCTHLSNLETKGKIKAKWLLSDYSMQYEKAAVGAERRLLTHPEGAYGHSCRHVTRRGVLCSRGHLPLRWSGRQTGRLLGVSPHNLPALSHGRLHQGSPRRLSTTVRIGGLHQSPSFSKLSAHVVNYQRERSKLRQPFLPLNCRGRVVP